MTQKIVLKYNAANVRPQICQFCLRCTPWLACTSALMTATCFALQEATATQLLLSCCVGEVASTTLGLTNKVRWGAVRARRVMFFEVC